jgi:hypothetical protein
MTLKTALSLKTMSLKTAAGAVAAVKECMTVRPAASAKARALSLWSATMTFKTVLAPNAPWPKPVIRQTKPKPASRQKRATSKRVDANFERWLQTVEPVRC